jgi:hypothetical protein
MTARQFFDGLAFIAGIFGILMMVLSLALMAYVERFPK